MMEEITDTDFKEKTAKGTSVVLFYKELCPYCKTMKGVVGKFAAKQGGVRIMRIDGEKNPSATKEMGAERFPDLFFIKDGEQVGRNKGLCNPQTLRKIYKQI